MMSDLGLTPIAETPMRAAIAKRMSVSQREIPQFSVSSEIDVDALEQELRRLEAKVPFTVALLKALADTLIDHPKLNAVWTENGVGIADSVNISIAIAVDEGLIAPALIGCATRDLGELATAFADLVSRARSGRIRGSEILSGTFMLSNLGMHNVSAFTALVTPPQVAVLAVGRSQRRLIITTDGVTEARLILTVTLSADHRVVDGVEVARFLDEFKRRLEDPVWVGGKEVRQ